MHVARLLVAALFLAACTSAAPGAGPSGSSAPVAKDGPLAVGAAAPAVTLTLTDGSKVDLAAQTGKQILVYFYPKDDTPGCTVEAKGIRDAWKDFEAAGITVYGVSTQDAASHKAFAEKHELPFALVVDSDEAVAKAFGVPVRMGFASRQSFLIGKDGKIKAAWPDVDPKSHADEVLKAAKS